MFIYLVYKQNDVKFFHTYKLLIYGFCYATLVLLGSMAIAYRPTVLQMEYAVYDCLQTWSAIDVNLREEEPGEPLGSALKELLFINLDSAFFDLETERVRRDKLSELLDSLNRRLDSKVIFLDFLFSGASVLEEADSLLIKSIRNMEDKLVLPYMLPPREFEMGEMDELPMKPDLVYIPRYCGYLDYRSPIAKEEVHRYVQLGKENDEWPSAIFELIRALRSKKEMGPMDHIPKVMEINYILRNQPPRGRREAVRFYSASEIINHDVQLPTTEKVVFIGLFDDYSGKYGLPIDKFQTPVASEMNGSYLIVNSYLNIVTDSFLRPVSWGLVFGINLVLAIAGAVYFDLMAKRKRRKLLEVIGSALFFAFFLLLLYSYLHIKFPFVLTTVFWAMNQHVYQLYKINFSSTSPEL